MPLESYVLGKLIGKGSYGQVSLARHKRDKKQVCLRFIIITVSYCKTFRLRVKVETLFGILKSTFLSDTENIMKN